MKDCQTLRQMTKRLYVSLKFSSGSNLSSCRYKPEEMSLRCYFEACAKRV